MLLKPWLKERNVKPYHFAKSIGMSTDQVAKQGETIKARNALLEETSKIPTLELNELLNKVDRQLNEHLQAK